MDGSEPFERNGSGDQTARPQYVKRALDHMNGNLAEKVTLAELGQPAGHRNARSSSSSRGFLAFLRSPTCGAFASIWHDGSC